MFRARPPEAFWSEATFITLLRLVVSMCFFVLAVVAQDITYNFIGLGVHWVGDVLDGFVARRFRQETIPGAELDLIADRVETLLFYTIFLSFHPHLYLPVAVYILNFAFVDFYLGYQFNKFGIISPNYFDRVDPFVHRYNFTPPAKFINSTTVAVLLIFFPRWWPVTTVLAAALLTVKVVSVLRLHGKDRRPLSRNLRPEETKPI